jgi:hypothetical protein
MLMHNNKRSCEELLIQAEQLGRDANRVLFENALAELQSLLGVQVHQLPRHRDTGGFNLVSIKPGP